MLISYIIRFPYGYGFFNLKIHGKVFYFFRDALHIKVRMKKGIVIPDVTKTKPTPFKQI